MRDDKGSGWQEMITVVGDQGPIFYHPEQRRGVLYNYLIVITIRVFYQ